MDFYNWDLDTNPIFGIKHQSGLHISTEILSDKIFSNEPFILDVPITRYGNHYYPLFFYSIPVTELNILTTVFDFYNTPIERLNQDLIDQILEIDSKDFSRADILQNKSKRLDCCVIDFVGGLYKFDGIRFSGFDLSGTFIHTLVLK